MKLWKIALIFLLFAVIPLVYAVPLLTSTQLNELNAIEGKAKLAEENACTRQCLIDGGWDPDSGLLPNANSSVVCNLKCSPNPCVRECQPQCSTLACIDECASPCNRAKYAACETACSGYENASDNFYLERCTCVCKSGYVPGAGDCVLDDGSGGGCRHNNDCQEGYICEGDKCVEDVWEPCTEDWECGSNAICENGACILQYDDECSSDSDCENGQKCINGDCVLLPNIDLDVPPVEDLVDLFSDEELFPEDPVVAEEMDDYTKEKIKSWLGLDVDSFPKDMGKGKKGYIVLSESISPNKLEILYVYKKIQYATAFMNHFGYNVRLVNRAALPANDDWANHPAFKAIADPGAGGVFYFSHAADPSIEDIEGDSIPTYLANSRKIWYMEQGMSESQARQKANTEPNGLDFYYNHQCHGADPGFKVFADAIIREGGVYYGEPGFLWAASPASTQYIRGYD